MPHVCVSYNEAHAVKRALELAAEEYDKAEKLVKDAGQPRLAEQFSAQAAEARILAERFDPD